MLFTLNLIRVKISILNAKDAGLINLHKQLLGINRLNQILYYHAFYLKPMKILLLTLKSLTSKNAIIYPV